MMKIDSTSTVKTIRKAAAVGTFIGLGVVYVIAIAATENLVIPIIKGVANRVAGENFF